MEPQPVGQLIEQGAEAKIYKITYENKPAILKQRVAKRYRHPDLDKKLSTQRINFESKIMATALNAGIEVPRIYRVDVQKRSIFMEYIDGVKVKDWLRAKRTAEEIKQLLIRMGQMILRLHNVNIIHGDLTTSNMMISNDKLYLIDFGLAYTKPNAEDKAVDLYVLERAFVSTHPELQKDFQSFYLSYNDKEILKRLEKVRQRGRKKVAFG